MNWITLVTLLWVSTMMNEAITLEDLKWKKRVLLVFPSSEEMGFDWEMSDSLALEIEDRDLIYFVFADTLHSNSSFTFDENYREELLKRYALGSKESCYVLIGKDGGSKVRKEGISVNWKDLFATIDAMPMRQREMGNNSKFFD
ncbi:DUF4174 domain-containing protein [Pleomorphovibrio marinus]|uniref:DUF4174 domain-containing protein n=1 Tax=Pleomorphovibrio marinus TaxID=2164132 RepID=UPI000E0A94FA|nr:DUF4174 domain-containing protein [Pleomorphovibrio marinus]